MASSERQQRGQTDYNPVNERQQIRLTDHLPSNEREQRGLTEIPSSERQQRCQRDQIPSNETEQRGPRIDIPSSEREQRGQREQTPTNERQQRCQRDQISSNLRNNSPHQAVGSRCRSEGLTYEYTVEGYDDDTDINTLYDNCPDDDVDYDQWVSLVNFWRSEEGKRRSNRSKESLEKAKVKPIHTTGTKSHARVRENMNQIKNVATEQGDQELDLDDDPISKVLGKDKYGRARGLGLGVKPSDVGDPSYPRF
ncbi:E3 ubiquitin-protein ligase SH3RF2 [Bienertia sinuspersici]